MPIFQKNLFDFFKNFNFPTGSIFGQKVSKRAKTGIFGTFSKIRKFWFFSEKWSFWEVIWQILARTLTDLAKKIRLTPFSPIADPAPQIALCSTPSGCFRASRTTNIWTPLTFLILAYHKWLKPDNL